MHTRIQIKETSQHSMAAVINVTSPYKYTSESKIKSTLYYSRLPASLTEEEIIQALLERDFSFIASEELNFIIVLVTQQSDGPQLTIVRDRFSSQQVYFKESIDGVLISTNLKDFKTQENSLCAQQIDSLLSNRITSHKSIFQNVNVLKSHQSISFDGNLNFLDLSENLRPKRDRRPLDDDEAIKMIRSSLFSSYKQFNENSDVAVLLSGGVDSFLLAATAARYFKNLKLYTPTWSDGDNPELPRAIHFAEHLGLPQQIVEINKGDFLNSYKEIMEVNPITIRNYSSLVLHTLFKHIPEKHILYGEYADTLFGNNSIKNILIDFKYLNLLKLFPRFLFPKKLSLLNHLEDSGLGHLVYIPQINETVKNRIKSFLDISLSDCINSVTSSSKLTRYDAVQYNLDSDCAQHMLEIETSASIHNKKIITPFYNQRMVGVSNRLSEQQLFGKTGLSILKNFKRDNRDQVKPILKKLACDFIAHDAIHLPKLGFPTPFSVWVEHYIEEELTGSEKELALGLESAEAQWSFINLKIILSHLAS